MYIDLYNISMSVCKLAVKMYQENYLASRKKNTFKDAAEKNNTWPIIKKKIMDFQNIVKKIIEPLTVKDGPPLRSNGRCLKQIHALCI